jgi:para-aminobenzoate synthetase/4-amino-4-deoxychorismate lyase
MLKIQDPDLDRLLNFLARRKGFFFLDTSWPDHENSESLLVLEPVDRLICREKDDLENYLAALQERLAGGFYLAGWIGYEFGAMLEGRIGAGRSRPRGNHALLADLGVFFKPYRFDHHTGENNLPFESAGRPPEARYVISNLRANMEQEEFVKVLDRVRQYILAGDTYAT